MLLTALLYAAQHMSAVGIAEVHIGYDKFDMPGMKQARSLLRHALRRVSTLQAVLCMPFANGKPELERMLKGHL